jgi:ribosomal protein L40E
MSQLAENAEHAGAQREEFWRPPASGSRIVSAAAKCRNCGAEYPTGARYCHLCGATREARPHDSRQALGQLWDSLRIREVLGLTTGPLIAFAAGMICLLAALFTGVAFQATSLSDWQAVQMWRVEWLLAAAVALLAGILLKKSEA